MNLPILEDGYLPRGSMGFARSLSSAGALMEGNASARAGAGRGEPFSLSWHTVSLSDSWSPLLHNVTGRIQSGQVTGLISSDRAATVALLETLANRMPGARYRYSQKMDVRVNDRVVDISLDSYRRRVTYLPFGDSILPPKLTVREALLFHSVMNNLSASSAGRLVNKIISNLKLQIWEDTLIEDLFIPERTRARVGVALVSRPAALLLESPLMGLDVYEAFQTVAVLKRVAQDLNTAVLISIDQPSSEVLFSLDEVEFLSKGSVVFSGPPTGIVDYFGELGYACPPSYSPSDFLLFLVEVLSPEEHDRLVSSWQWHSGNEVDHALHKSNRLNSLREENSLLRFMDHFVEEDFDPPESSRPTSRAVSDILRVDLSESPMDSGNPSPSLSVLPGSRTGVGYIQQTCLLGKRELIFLRRSWDGILLRFALVAILAVILSLMFYDVGGRAVELLETSSLTNGPSSAVIVNDYYGAICVMVIVGIFGQVEGVAVTIPAIRSLLLAERSMRADVYSGVIFFLVQIFISELPIIVITCIIHMSIAYWMVGFVGNFAVWVAIVAATAMATSSIGWLITAVTDSPVSALRLVPVVLLPQLLFSGILINVDLIPDWMNWMEFLCYIKYAVNLAFVNETQRFRNSIYIVHLANQNLINTDNHAWVYAMLLVAFVVGVRVIAASLLIYRKNKRMTQEQCQ
jgi:ABC-type multidrug transport system ATPase subunit